MNKAILQLLVLLVVSYVYAGHDFPLREGICHDYCIVNISPSTGPHAGQRPTSGACSGLGWLTCQCTYD